MKLRKRVLAPLVLIFVVVLLAIVVRTAPKEPVAVVRVVDAAGKPIAGATIKPKGLRTKAGPYRSGWYAWRGTTNAPVTTDQDGYARFPFPKYVFERIETGVVCLGVSHPDFVSDRPERDVAMAPPAGAPWKAYATYAWDLLRHKTQTARADLITLQKGATLMVHATSSPPASARLFAQVSNLNTGDDEFWIRPAPNMVMTRRVAGGKHTVRAVLLETNGAALFSETVEIFAVIGATNELKLDLKPGVTLRGQLDDLVPRPVKNGRLVVQVHPTGTKAQEDPPEWHAWTTIQEDGTFTITSLPAGELEVTAMCDGFVSTNGPGTSRMHYPQIATMTNDLKLTIGMEPTVRLEVKVTDEVGRPLPGIRVITWPNVRYGEWAATLLMGDCYNTADFMLGKMKSRDFWNRRVPDFEGVSDTNGIAVLPNLPAETDEVAIDDEKYQLPATTSTSGQKSRDASLTLIVGKTNYLNLQLEPVGKSAIKHY